MTHHFVFESLTDAIFFRDNWRQDHCIYKVSFVAFPSVLHRVCYTAWNENFPNHQLQAYDFWNKPPKYDSNTEVFAEEDIKILEVYNES